jgi:hypothetical protein
LENLKSKALNPNDYIEISAYQNLEKIYISAMEKIGDALSAIKTMKLKKQDQDKLINVLLSNK